MSKQKKIPIILIALLTLLLGPLLIFPDHTHCQLPIIVGNKEKADWIIADLVNQLGGLPKSKLDLAADQTANIYPVNNWEIESVAVGNTQSLLQSVTDDDPVYSYTIDFRTSYADGSQALLQWSSWRHGVVICPATILFSSDGPPGEIDVAH